MRAVLLEVPESLLDDRRRKGLDVFDEMWEGVLHMAPAPSRRHQRFAHKLAVGLDPMAESKDLLLAHETGLYQVSGDDNNYRIPDLIVYREDCGSDRGVDGRAELAVEVRSPNDETYDKLGFYGEVGVQELLVVDLDIPSIELFVLSEGELRRVEAGAGGPLHLSSLDVTLSLANPETLRIDRDGTTTDVAL